MILVIAKDSGNDSSYDRDNVKKQGAPGEHRAAVPCTAEHKWCMQPTPGHSTLLSKVHPLGLAVIWGGGIWQAETSSILLALVSQENGHSRQSS